MCDVLDRVEQRGIAQGKAEGIAQGKAEGIAQGKAEGLIEGAEEQARMTALNLQKMGLSQADIARAINRSSGLVQKWLGAEMA